MNNQRCISEKSLITIRKWLREAGDGPSTSIYLPSSKFNHKIIKRKKLNYYSKTTSIINWFYEFIKKVFTIYDNTTMSIQACPTCQFENVDSNINNHSSLNLSKSTQTNPNEQQSTIYPFYCFSVNDGHVIPLKFSSSKVIPITKNSISSSSPLCLNNEKSSNCCGTDPPISTIHHYDKRNCLIECCHSSNPPDIIFAESTCQLIKQAWCSSEKSI